MGQKQHLCVSMGGTEQAEDHVEDHVEDYAALIPLFGITLTSLHNASWLLEENEILVVGKLTRS